VTVMDAHRHGANGVAYSAGVLSKSTVIKPPASTGILSSIRWSLGWGENFSSTAGRASALSEKGKAKLPELPRPDKPRVLEARWRKPSERKRIERR
jgi:hypothetical protein